MKQPRLERITNSTFTQLNLGEEAYFLGGATEMVRITGPFTYGAPGLPPDGGKPDVLPDA
ncbi:MAG TPA: hypothetical protein VI756_08375 [Blastocatellia bacterium]